ncbi:MAG: T9SS type A sorting domain-containing protein [Endomicrobium sp.]|nr:T9SS type A sorting domain-containing protein [Endomicrobium sp.]
MSKLEAKIYNINGEFIRSFSILELIDDLNRKSLSWDLRNEKGDKVTPGIYFISIKTDSEQTQIRKFAVQK